MVLPEVTISGTFWAQHLGADCFVVADFSAKNTISQFINIQNLLLSSPPKIIDTPIVDCNGSKQKYEKAKKCGKYQHLVVETQPSKVEANLM